MKKISAWLAAAAAFALLLAACGGEDPTPTPTPAPTATPTPTAAAPTDDGSMSGDEIPTAEFRFLAGQATYAPFIEGWREMVDRGTGGKITFTPQDATEQEAMDFILRNRQEYDADGVSSTGLMFRLNEDHVPLWDTAEDLGITPQQAVEQNMNFTGGLTVSPRPQNLWMSFPAACMNWYTLDPEIRTVHDFVGKRILMGQPGNTVLPVAILLTEAAGIRGQFEEIIGGAKPGTEMLQDRDVDATGNGIIFAGHPLASATSAVNQVAALTGSLFNVDTPLDVIEKTRADNPAWTANGLLPAVKLHRGDLSRAAQVDFDMVRAEEEWCTGSITVNFMTSPASSESAVYHIGRSIAENLDLADDYFPFISLTWKTRGTRSRRSTRASAARGTRRASPTASKASASGRQPSTAKPSSATGKLASSVVEQTGKAAALRLAGGGRLCEKRAVNRVGALTSAPAPIQCAPRRALRLEAQGRRPERQEGGSMRRILALLAIAAAFALTLAACGGEDPTPTPRPTATPTAADTMTPENTPTPTPGDAM
ncbi:MAG: hypothetical protein J4F32_03815, partial [Dehalococcoidia bacterium]|nr:hypothetical protein [Dehalococcoidia bacterium]